MVKSFFLRIEDLPEVPPDAAPTYTVVGEAEGVLEPLNLRLEHSDGFELLSIEEDGAFAFQAQLGDDVLYSVSLLGDPPCVIENATDRVSGASPKIVVACESVLLSDLTLSAPTAPDLDFEPARRAYDAEVSLLQQSVRVTAMTASPDASITIAGVPVEAGVPSEPIALALGENEIDIEVTHPSGSRRVYRVAVARAAEIAQRVYGKASNTQSEAYFGSSMAIWGDTLAIGAPSKESVYIFRRAGDTWQQEAHFEFPQNDLFSTGFGRSLALWKDCLVVGMPSSGFGNAGSTRVYRRSGATWEQEATLSASNRADGDLFGGSVAVWENTVAVSATGEASAATGVNGDQDDNSAPRSGAVYVFRRSDSSWAREAYIKASNTDADDSFGEALALWGDTLAVSATGEDSAASGINADGQTDNSSSDSGAVYVFRRFDSAWVQEAYLKASNSNESDRFGASLALQGDTLAVAAPSEDGGSSGINGDQYDRSLETSGAVYVFQRSGLDWTQEAYIKSSNPDPGDGFGRGLSLWGGLLAVGAAGEDSAATGVNGNQDDAGAPNSGAVYLFQRTDSSWTQLAYVKASNPEGACTTISGCSGDRFGTNLALWNGHLAAAAPYEDSAATGMNGDQSDNSARDSGATYIFH